MSGTSENLKFGVAGTGIFATDSHLPTVQKIQNLEPKACYNRTRLKAEAFAEKAGIDSGRVEETLEDLFKSEDLDFVDALLPVQFNLDAVKLAVKYGKPLCFEKPISADLKGGREIVKLASESDVPIAVLENWSFLSSIDIIKREVLLKIGNVVGFTYHATGAWNASNKYASTSWRQKPEHIGGYLSDGGVHQLALLTDVLGPVESISALTKQIRDESGADDTLFSTMKMESGVIGTFTYGSAFGATEKSTSFTVFGTEGSFIYDFSPSLDKPTITYKTGGSMQAASKPTIIKIDEKNTLEEEFKNFAEVVLKMDKALIKVPPQKAFHHLAVVAAALESSSKHGDSMKVEKP